MPMTYGNAKPLSNNTANNICGCCNDKIDKHTINVIHSSDETDNLARKLQSAVDVVYKVALNKGYEEPDSKMVAAAIATLGTKVVKVIALSGNTAGQILKHIKSIGNDVNVVSESVQEFKTIAGCKFPTPTRPNIQPTPPLVGTCAAQKVLWWIIKEVGNTKCKGIKINMSELYWKTNNTHSNFSSGEAVESCDTCRQVIPRMLCDKWDF